MAKIPIPFTVKLPRALKKRLKAEAKKRHMRLLEFTPLVVDAGLRAVAESESKAGSEQQG